MRDGGTQTKSGDRYQRNRSGALLDHRVEDRSSVLIAWIAVGEYVAGEAVAKSCDLGHPITVTIGINALRNACFMVTRFSSSPFARAVRT